MSSQQEIRKLANKLMKINEEMQRGHPGAITHHRLSNNIRKIDAVPVDVSFAIRSTQIRFEITSNKITSYPGSADFHTYHEPILIAKHIEGHLLGFDVDDVFNGINRAYHVVSKLKYNAMNCKLEIPNENENINSSIMFQPFENVELSAEPCMVCLEDTCGRTNCSLKEKALCYGCYEKLKKKKCPLCREPIGSGMHQVGESMDASDDDEDV